MKKLILSLFLFIIGVSLFSCKKHNPEDPWFSHGGKHLNERLEGEWELVSLHIIKNTKYPFDQDEEYEDYSNLLEIDTMNIAKFFKFVPTKNINKTEGEGEVFIRSKNMPSYPEKVGISQSLLLDLSDTNVALAKLTYLFKEGKVKNFFRFRFADITLVDTLTPDIPVFKPFDEYFVFNNFFIKSFDDFEIWKATQKELILYNDLTLDGSPFYRRYRLAFKKIK